MKTLITPVLYCRCDNRWKLTDFGISAKATSRRAHTTVYSKGTSSYRAPELLAEHAAFTNRVDIWALACIIHELATGKVAFHEDWAVREYFHHGYDLPVSLPSLPAFLQHHIAATINDLLNRDWNRRPPASTVCSIFLAYSRLMNLFMSHMLINAQSYPSYPEWKELVGSHQNSQDFFSKLADVYEQKGATAIAEVMRQTGIHSQDTLYLEASILASSGSLVTKSREIDLEKADYGAVAVRFCEAALEQKPESFWPWHNISQVNIRIGDFDTAIRACNQGNTRFPLNPWPVLAVTNVYATKSEYHEAIMVYMEFFTKRKEWPIVDLLLADPRERVDQLISRILISNENKDLPHENLKRLSPSTIDDIKALKPWLSARASELWDGTQTTLSFAAWTGDRTSVELCIRRESAEKQFFSQDSDEYTPLHLAVWNMHTDVVKLLLDVTVTWVSKPGRRGWTPLHFAAWNNDVTVIQQLLTAGATLSPQDSDGWTPMHSAANRGNLDAVRILIKAGADVSVEEREGWTPMHRAAFYGHVDVIKELTDAGADVSARSHNGSCPLHWAAVAGRTAVVKALISAGADVSARENYGWMPLHRAATFGHLDAVKVLLEANVDISAPSDTGATALHWAAENGHVPVVLTLIDVGANVSVQDGTGWTPMHRAATFGHGDVITILRNAGADVSARDDDGRTPLRWALSLGHSNAIEALKEANASLW